MKHISDLSYLGLTGFRKVRNAQYTLLNMPTLDKANPVSVIFMDLSKAFETLNRDLLIAKLKFYCFFTVSFVHT